MNIQELKAIDEVKFNFVEKFKEILKGFPYKTFIVGGWVRDLAAGINKDSYDVDIVVDTDNGYNKLANYLNDCAEVEILQWRNLDRFGISQLTIQHEELGELDLDICMTRGELDEWGWATFGTLRKDAERRDFTINSLYLNVKTGEILDPTGKGLKDLDSNILRPNDLSDPMRLFRAARFDAQGFKLSEEDRETIKELARENKKEIEHISFYRLYHEFHSLVTSRFWKEGVENLRELGLMGFIDEILANAEGIDYEYAEYLLETKQVVLDVDPEDDGFDEEYETRLEALYQSL